MLKQELPQLFNPAALEGWIATNLMIFSILQNAMKLNRLA